MKIVLKLTLILISIFIMEEKSLALTDYKIKKICKKEKRELTCIKDLKEKRSKLQKGILIEIPVIPFKSD